jgi:NodT family efflux transporter outer membrane factor (OMF) lipoprotein
MKLLKLLYIPLLLWAGCAVYEPYKRPEIITDGLFRDVQPEDTTALAALSWREFFKDERLQALIEQGLKQNTELNIARLRIEAAEAVLMSAQLSYLPSVSLTSEGNVSRFDRIITRTHNLGAAASWEIDVWGKVTNAKRSAEASMEGSRAYEQAVQTRLVANIASSYYTLIMLDCQLDISKRTLESWVEMEKTLEAMKRAGKLNDAAVLQARASRLSVENTVLSVQKSLHDTENSLSVLLAMTPQAIRRGTLSEQHFPEKFSIGLPVQLLSNRPDVRQAEANLAQAFYSTNVARAAFYPNITLSGAAGWTNNAGGTIVNPGSWLLNAVGSITQPLFNKGVNSANLKVAETQQKEAQLLFQQSLLNAGKEVNDAMGQWQTAQQRILLDIEQIKSLKEAVRKTELLMQYSTANYLEILTARQNLLNAEQTEVQDRFDEIQGVINLYQSLGGGL